MKYREAERLQELARQVFALEEQEADPRRGHPGDADVTGSQFINRITSMLLVGRET